MIAQTALADLVTFYVFLVGSSHNACDFVSNNFTSEVLIFIAILSKKQISRESPCFFIVKITTHFYSVYAYQILQIQDFTYACTSEKNCYMLAGGPFSPPSNRGVDAKNLLC